MNTPTAGIPQFAAHAGIAGRRLAQRHRRPPATERPAGNPRADTTPGALGQHRPIGPGSEDCQRALPSWRKNGCKINGKWIAPPFIVPAGIATRELGRAKVRWGVYIVTPSAKLVRLERQERRIMAGRPVVIEADATVPEEALNWPAPCWTESPRSRRRLRRDWKRCPNGFNIPSERQPLYDLLWGKM